MAKNCTNCKFSKTYDKPSFLDGKYVWRTEHCTCVNKNSIHWYREVNNLITCDRWEKQNEKD